MRRLVGILLLALVPALAMAAEQPDWAYPVTPKRAPPDKEKPLQAPGSAKTLTEAQIDDGFNPPDWFPDEHPPMPSIVAHGSAPKIRGCALCHLPTGNGHPESSGIAGLPVQYFLRQMEAFKTGGRKGGRAAVMIEIAQAISDTDARAAAEYFAALKPREWTKVVETDTVPKSFVGAGGMRFVAEPIATEPTGNRVIELPQDAARAKLRDPHSGFIAHVRVGSIAKGKDLVMTGGGKTTPCAICHGPELKGLGEVPSIVGRSPMYVFRQLNDIKSGDRSGSWVELMKPVVAQLNDEDMVAIAAYLTSRGP